MSEEEKKAIEGLKHTAENPESKFWIGTQGMENIKIVLNLIEKQQKELEQVKKFGIPIETLCAEFERLENLEDKTDELKIELEDKQKEIENQREQKKFWRNGFYHQQKVIEELYISKDKIKEIIKYIKSLTFEENSITRDYILTILEELLEEK